MWQTSLNGVLASDDDASSEAEPFSAQTIKIVTKATSFNAGGRGAMLDNIALTEALPINQGYEDSAIKLSAITAALADTDGSESLSAECQ